MIKKFLNIQVKKITCQDIRFPTGKIGMGSDAVHKDPNYSTAYVNIYCVDKENPKNSIKLPIGKATIFTLGRGNELCCQCVDLMAPIVEGKSLADIFDNFGLLWMQLANHH